MHFMTCDPKFTQMLETDLVLSAFIFMPLSYDPNEKLSYKVNLTVNTYFLAENMYQK